VKLMLIARDVELVRFACGHGVDRPFVDLERLGKAERQGTLDTVQSAHTLEDVAAIRDALPDAELLVRIDPPHPGSREQARAAMEHGARLIMLPMFRHPEEVAEIADVTRGKVGLVPLVETPQALARLPELTRVAGVTEIYFGLNDLHLAFGLANMFEILSSGLLDGAAEVVREAGIPFGFGGIARLGEGVIPADLVLAEHVRLGSSSVILARAFVDRATTREELAARVDLRAEIAKLRARVVELSARSAESARADRDRLRLAVERCVHRARREGAS